MKTKKKHFYWIVLLIIFLLFISVFFTLKSKTNAQYAGGAGGGSSSSVTSSRIFGGKIANTKAERIMELESENYHCSVSGTTIEVTPISSKMSMPYSYIIPYGVENKTGFSLRDGQWIIGKYNGTTTVECIFQGEPPVTQTVTLETITIYGTSKQ